MSEQKPNGNADDLNDLLDSEYALQMELSSCSICALYNKTNIAPFADALQDFDKTQSGGSKQEKASTADASSVSEVGGDAVDDPDAFFV